MSQAQNSKPFRVVVVGAGMVGCAMSHALQLANIDHVVLEKHSKIVSVHGAALTIFPGVARIFDQFGFLKKIQDTVTPIQSEVERWPDGTINVTGRSIRQCGEMFDCPVILFDRERCVKALYDNLPDQSRVRTNACVDRIEHTETGVKVYLTDGTVEEGDIVVGADGVHSGVRQKMWDYADKHEPGAIPASDKDFQSSQYKGIFGVSEKKGTLETLGASDVHVVYGHDTTKLLFTQPGFAYWAIMWKDEFSKPPKRFKPTPEEHEEAAHKLKDIVFTENVKLADLWKYKNRGGLLNIEEGVLDKWHAGRIVLVGDSAHKMSADLGIGANMAIESAVVLCNILQRETKDNLNRHFSLQELYNLFAEYQKKRHERVSIFKKLSGDALRMRSFETFWKRIFVSRIATISAFKNFQSGKMFEGMAKAPKLDYVPTQTINEDAPGWKLGETEEKGTTGAGWLSYALLTSVVGVAISYAAVNHWGSLLQQPS